MEITLQKESFLLYETEWRKFSDLYVEADCIVPDTKPDIGRVLKTEGRGKILAREELGDKCSIRGEAVYTVLYAPENDADEMERMEVRIPFKDILTIKEGQNTEILADAEVLPAETMLINSRKISLKGKVGISLEGIKQKEAALCTGAEAQVPLEMKMKKVRLCAPVGRGSFTVTAADTLEVPEENPPVREILHTEAYVGEENVKLITGKIILKGTVRLKTLYLSPVQDFPLCTMEHEIPFTEILDMPDADENMDCMLDYEITDIYWETEDDPEGARGFGAEVTMEVRAKTVWETELEILDDCFCPGHATEVKYEKVMTERAVDTLHEEISVRKTVSLPPEYPSIGEVCALFTKPEVKSVSVRDGAVEAEGYTAVQLLYRSGDGENTVHVWDERIPFSFSAPTKADETAEIAVRTRQGGASYSLSDPAAADVRAVIAFDICLTEKREILSVSEIVPVEEEPEKKPSVRIVFTKKGDSLWSLAKKYGVSTEKIAATNGLSEDEVREGMLLVVPRG